MINNCILNKKIFFFFCFSVLLLLGVSEDSYIHDLFGQCDSAIFYTCGKAWMEGLTPYIDFADSKGPFLWLIYGIGYLISPVDYTGIYWLACINYTFTFYFAFKTAKIFLKDDRYSILASLLTSFAFFNPLCHNEVRAEDFALLYVTISLYIMSKILYNGQYDRKHIGKDAFFLGVCFGLCLLIKFSISAMLGIFLVYLIFWSIREKCSTLTIISTYCLGILLTCIPFVVYFLIKGNFSDFINEYFINTLFTVNPEGRSTKNLVVRLFIWNYSRLLTGLLAALIPVWLGYIKHDRYFLLISILFFFLVISPNAQMGYYFNICSIFGLFTIIGLMHLLEKSKWTISKSFFRISTIVILVSCVMYHFQIYHFGSKHCSHSLKTQTFKNDSREKFIYYSNIVKRKDKAKILYWGCMDIGIGTPGRSIPACKYWTLQNGATESMLADQRNTVEKRIPDFVIIEKRELDKEKKLLDLNYQKHDSKIPTDDLLLFSKH